MPEFWPAAQKGLISVRPPATPPRSSPSPQRQGLVLPHVEGLFPGERGVPRRGLVSGAVFCGKLQGKGELHTGLGRVEAACLRHL